MRTDICMYSGLNSMAHGGLRIQYPHLTSGACPARLEDRVADDRAAVAVLERRAQRGHVLVVHDAVEQVVHLVDHRVLPADDVAVGPPVRDERMVPLGDRHAVEALRLLRLLADPEDLELVEALEVEAGSMPFSPLISKQLWFLRPAGVTRGLQGPDGPVLELHDGHERVVHVHLARALAVQARAFLDERAGQGALTELISPIRKRPRSMMCAPRSPRAPDPAASFCSRQMSGVP